MKSNLWGVVGIVCGLSCSSRPPPTLVERNYESGERIKQVEIGGDRYWVFSKSEPEAEAKQRLLADVAKECPRYQVLAEGRGTQPRLARIIHEHREEGRKLYRTVRDES